MGGLYGDDVSFVNSRVNPGREFVAVSAGLVVVA
jgi:hypothetical protein